MSEESKTEETKNKKKSLKELLKEKYNKDSKTSIPEFTTLSIKDYVNTYPPFDERFNKQNKWLENPYSYNTWYYNK